MILRRFDCFTIFWTSYPSRGSSSFQNERMGSRDRNFDTTSGRWYEPNHFITTESTNARNAKITNFFHGQAGSQKPKTNELLDLELPKKQLDHSVNKNTRKLRSETVQRWKSNDLAIYDANDWLTYQEETLVERSIALLGSVKFVLSLKNPLINVITLIEHLLMVPPISRYPV